LYLNLCFGNLVFDDKTGGRRVKVALFDMDGVLCDNHKEIHILATMRAKTYLDCSFSILFSLILFSSFTNSMQKMVLKRLKVKNKK